MSVSNIELSNKTRYRFSLTDDRLVLARQDFILHVSPRFLHSLVILLCVTSLGRALVCDSNRLGALGRYSLSTIIRDSCLWRRSIQATHKSPSTACLAGHAEDDANRPFYSALLRSHLVNTAIGTL